MIVEGRLGGGDQGSTLLPNGDKNSLVVITSNLKKEKKGLKAEFRSLRKDTHMSAKVGEDHMNSAEGGPGENGGEKNNGENWYGA